MRTADRARDPMARGRGGRRPGALAAVAMVAFLILGPTGSGTAWADLERVILEVHGLACPFCAYGLEKKLLRLEGVRGIEIEMDAGRVTLELEPGAVVGAPGLRRAVADAGFTLAGVEVVASGRLQRRQGRSLLEIAEGAWLILRPGDGFRPAGLAAFEEGRWLRVRGRAREPEEVGTALYTVEVNRVEAIPPPAGTSSSPGQMPAGTAGGDP